MRKWKKKEKGEKKNKKCKERESNNWKENRLIWLKDSCKGMFVWNEPFFRLLEVGGYFYNFKEILSLLICYPKKIQ